MTDRSIHAPHHRMPFGLGPASGPRNMPADRAHLRFDGDVTQVSVTVAADRDRLARIVPPRCVLGDDPVVEVQYMRLARLGWLAGRSYNVLALRVPLVFHAAAGPIACTFMPVLWEDMADPILTGREELGSPKLFADIADPCRVGETWRGHASWDGFRFFELETDALAPDHTPPVPRTPTLLHRYHARTGAWHEADIDQMTIAGPGEAPPARVHERRIGRGRIGFVRPRWEDMPTQYTFVNALADLDLPAQGEARLVRSSGMMDLAAQRVID
jgi:hypothetical protein